jgi:serine/threonine-protein kinase HipA
MTERTVLVCVELDGQTVPAGRLFMRVLRGRESASFSYEPTWLEHPRRFALDPIRLPLTRGSFTTARAEKLFPGLSDSAPDRWGRTLMARAARLEHPRRTLFESDYLLRVYDPARQGALRFSDADGGPFLADGGPPIPPLVRLSELLAASDRVQAEGDDAGNEALRLLLALGSSLGGARPKASVLDSDGALSMAKFPARSDEWPVTTWEKVASDLAARAKIAVGLSKLVSVGGVEVLVARRFDRGRQGRIPFLSAMAMIGSRDGDEDRSYLEIADAIRQHGEHVDADLRELWRRMIFNVLISNTDDHSRNHGFLRGAQGWTLAPAYDLNPMPLDVKPRIHALKLDESSPESSLDTVLSVADYFGIEASLARAAAGEVATAVSNWRSAAKKRGLRAGEVDRMASAFEHEDLAKARQLAR